MSGYQRKCIVLGNDGITGRGSAQNWNYTGASVPASFNETNTRWVRFWADWTHIQPNGRNDANFGTLDDQIYEARRANPPMSIILTAYQYPQWANQSSSKFWFPGDVSRNSDWGNFIAMLYQRYDRFAPANAGITIDALEVVNEPNAQSQPQRSSTNGPVTSHQKVFQMFNTADQIGAERSHSLWLMGPALADRQGSSTNDFIHFAEWMDLFFTLGFRGNSKWIWTHHNYVDCESKTQSTAVARSKLINKWSGYSDGDGPALFNTEGGHRLFVDNDQDRQRNNVVDAFGRGLSGTQAPGVGMFSNYLLYDDPVSNANSGLRNSVTMLDNPLLAEHQRRGGRRKVYPAPNLGISGFAQLQTGPTTLRDWRGSENLGPWLQWDPGAATMRAGHLAVFAIGGGNPRNCWVNQRISGNNWTGWQSLGGECYSGPAAVSRQDNIMDAFVKGPNENIWATAFTPDWWGGWWSLGGWATSDPAVCSMHGSQLELFVRGPDNRLYHKWWYGGDWSDWYAMDNNTWSSGPGAVSMTNGRMDVVCRGNNNWIYHYYFTSDTGWHGPFSLEAPTANGQTYASTAARICSWGNRRLDVFARGPDGRVYRRIFDDVWGKWEPVLIFSGGPFGVAAECWEAGRIDLFSVESSGNVHRWMYQS